MGCSLLISPTDRNLHHLGKVSSLPEKWGCDVVIRTPRYWAGVQRKELKDLIASVQDGRLAEEVQRMAACGRLDVQVLLVEGHLQWTVDGVLLGKGFGAQWTIAQHRGLLWSVRDRGIWVDTTRDLPDTAIWLQMFAAWCAKDRHHSLVRRPGAISAWGKPDNREYGIHMMQGLPGVGPELAERMWEEFGGVPWAWTVGQDELVKVPGIGKKKADAMLNMLRSPPRTVPPAP